MGVDSCSFLLYTHTQKQLTDMNKVIQCFHTVQLVKEVSYPVVCDKGGIEWVSSQPHTTYLV